jgi:photosystem II stability/assembly factor-like uncharacterized protein
VKRAPFIFAVVAVSMGLFGAAATAASAASAASVSGRAWVAHHLEAGPLLSVAAPDAAHAWAVGPAPSIVATSNGGATWRAQDPGTKEALYGVAFSDATHGWAVGDADTIVATSDGGVHWTTQTTPSTAAPLIGVAARGSDVWAVGAGGAIVATSDGGGTWAAQSSQTSKDLYSVTFADATHGWAVGDAGTIVSTSDGGVHWTTQRSPTTDYLNGVTCSGELHAWAVGESGVIIETIDGGAHWTVARRSAPKASDLYTAAFAGRHRGWAVGDGGIVLATTDGGRSWRVQHAPTSEALASVAFPNALHGFASGTAGTMLTTTHAGWSDTRPPVVSATGGAGWHRGAVRVRLHATDRTGGSGVASLAYSLDRGKTWRAGSSFVVAAPADHSNDGLHGFLYRALDNAGNVAPARRGVVGIDTSRPTPTAERPAVAVRGERAVLRFRVGDRRPGGPTATVTVRVRDARGALVMKMVLRSVRVDAALTCAFTCRLPAGAYRFVVAAVDAAGNGQSSQARNTLTVRAAPVHAAAAAR